VRLNSKVGDIVLETRVGRILDAGEFYGKWIYQMRGTLCHGPDCSCGIAIDEWMTFGPFESEKEANRASRKHERERMKMHGIKGVPAPDPGSLN
jgi:hypothetical protein